MKFKKFMAAIVSVAMIISCVVLPAHAEGETTAPIVVTYADGTTEDFTSLASAMEKAWQPENKITVYRDITESMNTLKGNIVCGNPDGVKITNTYNSDWIYCAYDFTIGEGITYDAGYLFAYAGNCVINGTVTVFNYYQMYAGTKLTINEPGSMTVTTTDGFFLRSMQGDPNAGIYINGDNNDATIGLKANVIYFYQGMISAKDANLQLGVYYQSNASDNQGSANLVLDNSTLVVSKPEYGTNTNGNTTITLKNNSSVTANGGFTVSGNTQITTDDTSAITKNGVNLFPAAKIGDTKYDTFPAAISAAKTGETVELLHNVALSSTVDINKDITIDGAGYTITQTDNFKGDIALFELTSNAAAKFENITFDGIKKVAIMRSVDADVTIDNCVIQNCEHTQTQGLVRLAIGDATIANTKFLNNTCSMVVTYNYDAGNADDVFAVNNCTFENNISNGTAALYYVKGAKCTLTDNKFIGNTVNGSNNCATVYMGFTENNVITGNIFKNNTVIDSTESARVGGAIFFGYETEFKNNVIVGNTATNVNGDKLGQVCLSKYYDCDMDISGNYWGGTKPVAGTDYGFVHETGESTFVLDSFYKTYTETENGFSLSDLVENKLPNAEVKDLGSITVKNNEGDYKFDGSYYEYDLIHGGGLKSVTNPFDLQIAMEFIAKDTTEQAAANAYGNYTTDFFIKITGLKDGSFIGDGCYLAGYYPSFGAWVKIPLDGFKVENGVVYPVITTAGFDFKYTDICGSVQDFICGIYLSEDVIKKNPDINVQLDLGLSETFEAAQKAEFTTVDSYVYDAEDLKKDYHGIFGIGFYVVDIDPVYEDTYRIGLFAGIDSLKYKEVGFKIYDSGKYLASGSTTDVYKKITASNMTLAAEEFDLFRFFGIPVDFPTSYDNVEGLQFQPYAIDLFGNTIDGRMYDIYDIYTLDEKEVN